MNRTRWTARRLVALGVVGVAATAAGAQAAGGGVPSPQPPRALSPAVPVAPAAVPAVAGGPPVVVTRQASGDLICRSRDRRRPAAPVPVRAPAAAAPSEALKNAFGILRRERTDDDALPARLLVAVKARGFTVVDPQSTRLLRADRRARAWVVPVPDTAPGTSVVCRGPRPRALAAAKPREGLVVVAVGGAPSGGGGALADLRRGLAAVALDPCAGAGHDMLGVSGVVPDGVEAVFVTAADGSATRADVRDNGYAFVLPRPRRPDARYVVWTGTDGAPHVQPLPSLGVAGAVGSCGRVAGLLRVTPDPFALACAPKRPQGLMFPSRAPRPAVARRRAASGARARARARRGVRRAPLARAPATPSAIPLALALGSCAFDVSPRVLFRAPIQAAPVPRAAPPRPAVAPRAAAPPIAPAPRPAPAAPPARPRTP
ncbi:MAG: hypothetical protein QOE77_4170, partial [Blastocatellia bacterium]|nr:hypothetical protein [Blastocatellia bacterium]